MHERLDLLFGATVAAARDMKTLVFAQVSACTTACRSRNVMLLFEASKLTDHQMNSRKNEQKVLSWRQEEMSHRRQFRHRHLQSHNVTDFG